MTGLLKASLPVVQSKFTVSEFDGELSVMDGVPGLLGETLSTVVVEPVTNEDKFPASSTL